MDGSADTENLHASRLISALIVIGAFLSLLLATAWAQGQTITSLSANAKGQGTLTVGKETFKVPNVVATLKEDGTGELILITDITLFVTCTWSGPADLSKGIDLKITGGTSAGSATGTGKLFLGADAKSITGLKFEARSNARKRKILLDFVAE